MILKKNKNLDIILGLFITLGLISLVLLVFLIGKERKLFDIRTNIEAHFPNVAGLSVGADVMLSGVVVGYVGQINFPLLRKDTPQSLKDITVVLRISKSSMEWIREDSVARIDSKGLLGDKLINISIGSADSPHIKSGGMIKSNPALDLNKSLENAQKILEDITETVADAKQMFKGFVQKGGNLALANSAKSLQKILNEVEKGEGVIHELVFDKKAGQDIKQSINDLNTIIKQAKEGPGLAHALFFDKNGQETIKNAKDSLGGLADLLKEIKTGSGVLHELIYADEVNFIKSLNETASLIESLIKDINEGRGSLGLLIKDQSLYNEIYGLIGNLNRNRLLKEIIRRNISKSEKK